MSTVSEAYLLSELFKGFWAASQVRSVPGAPVTLNASMGWTADALSSLSMQSMGCTAVVIQHRQQYADSHNKVAGADGT